VDFLKKFFTGFIQDPKTKMLDPLICPNCNDQQLQTRENFGVKLYICYKCRGCFLSQDSLNNILSFQGSADWPEIFEADAHTLHTFERSGETRKCPGCRERMDNTQFRYSSGIWVDYCPNGHGVWLDGGEMRLIKDYHERISSSEGLSYEEKQSLSDSFKTLDHRDDPSWKIVEGRSKWKTGMERERERYMEHKRRHPYR